MAAVGRGGAGMEDALRSHAGLGELMRAAAGELEHARSELAQERKKTALLEGAIKTQQAQILSLSCNNEEIAKRLNAELRLPTWFGGGKEEEVVEAAEKKKEVVVVVKQRSPVALSDAILDMVRCLCRGTTTHGGKEPSTHVKLLNDHEETHELFTVGLKSRQHLVCELLALLG